MKDNTVKIAGASALAISIFVASGLSFFDMIIRCKDQNRFSGSRWRGFSHAKLNHPRDKFAQEYEAGKAWCRAQTMQDCYIQSADGLRLHASLLPAERPERIVLLSHGYRGSAFGDFAGIARFLHENGCSLLFIDQRCCGQSEGSYITFGALEQSDVQRWAWYLSRHNSGGLPIYLYGQSMGAAAVLMAAGRPLPPAVKGLISDCGFVSMKKQMQYLAADWFHLRWIGLLLLRLQILCPLLGGFQMKDADTAPALAANRRPILFIHGCEDTYVNPKNSRENYARCRAPKELVLVPGARHLCSAYEAPELYRAKLLHFFHTYR